MPIMQIQAGMAAQEAPQLHYKSRDMHPSPVPPSLIPTASRSIIPSSVVGRQVGGHAGRRMGSGRASGRANSWASGQANGRVSRWAPGWGAGR